MIYKSFDIVGVPFPFVDSLQTKIRPALVISHHHANKSGSVVLAMITSALHQKMFHDIVIADLKTTNLPAASLIRMKLFTIDVRLIHKKIGMLALKDQKSFKEIFQQIFSDML